MQGREWGYLKKRCAGVEQGLHAIAGQQLATGSMFGSRGLTAAQLAKVKVIYLGTHANATSAAAKVGVYEKLDSYPSYSMKSTAIVTVTQPASSNCVLHWYKNSTELIAPLPAGISINTSKGSLTVGNLTANGDNYSCRVELASVNSAPFTLGNSYSIYVNSTGPTLNPMATLPAATCGSYYHEFVTATGAVDTWKAVGLPKGWVGSVYADDSPEVTDIKLGIIAPDGRDAMVQHAEQFAKAGIPFVFDPGQQLPRFDGAELRDFVEKASWVAVNDYEGKMLSDRTGISHAEITEDRLAAERRNDLADDAKAWQDHDVHFRVPEEPEQMLIQYRVTAGGRIKECTAKVTVD